MPQRMTLEIGTRIVTLDLNGTATQVAAALTAFLAEKGISLEGTAEERMLRYLQYQQKQVALVAKASKRKELEAAQSANINTQVDTEISF